MTNTHQRKPGQDRWGKYPGDVFRELLQEREVTKYVDVYSSAEGTEFPSGLEMHAFWILTPDGKLWVYTVDWNPEKLSPDGEKGYYTLTEPREVSGWDNRPHYIRARKELGLSLTEEQQKILRKWEEEYK